MTTFSQAIQNSTTESLTANGMVTFKSSLDYVVDFFFSVGSSRGKDMSLAFASAYAGDPDLAMKVLFWARDIRGGAGERETFRKLLKYLELNHPSSLEKNMIHIPEYGRFDDLFVFETKKFKNLAYRIVNDALRAGNGLAAKWCPRKGPVANELRKYMNYSPKDYRQLLVRLTKVVESQMCAKQWNEIDYNHVPSVASARYQKAFGRNDQIRYSSWKEGLKTGESKVNASTLYPYEVLKSINYGDASVASAQWDALPNYLSDNRILPVVDVSGSMESQVGGQKGVGLSCMDVSLSLGLYLADKQSGAFKDCILTFSEKSELKVLNGTLLQKLAQLQECEWGANTNLESAFRAILQKATENNVPQAEMPKMLVVLTDLEFDPARQNGKSIGAFDLASKMFEIAGYTLPSIVWWNLNARPNATGNVPVRFDQSGTALVSGFSPSMLKAILAGKDFTPRGIMLEAVNGDRYARISA